MKKVIVTGATGFIGANLTRRLLRDGHSVQLVVKPGFKEESVRITNEIYDLVFKLKGSTTGEHAIGRNRSLYLKKEWGEPIYGYMKEIKRIFDPDNFLNPDTMFPRKGQTLTTNLKY